MKIGPVSPYNPPGRGVSPSASKPTPFGFQQVFNASLDRLTEAHPKPSAVVQTFAPAPLGTDAIESIDSATGIQLMERFIDTLEVYQKRLADPKYHLRDIAPALERLEEAHAHLSRFATEASSETTLGGLMNEGLVTAAMEITRFHSGVYC